MSTRALRELLRALRGDGKCLLFSSHVMQEVAALCDRIVILGHGRVVAPGTAAELVAQSGASRSKMRSSRCSAPAKGWPHEDVQRRGAEPHPRRRRKEIVDAARPAHGTGDAAVGGARGPIFLVLMFNLVASQAERRAS